MELLNECSFLSKATIKTFEKKYDAKYLLETSLKQNNQWLNFPVALFYTKDKHPKGSHYFAIYQDGYTTSLMITNGESAVNDVIYKGIDIDGKVLYSRYRHDFRYHSNGVYVDGGRDYFKVGGNGNLKIVNFKIDKDQINFLD